MIFPFLLNNNNSKLVRSVEMIVTGMRSREIHTWSRNSDKIGLLYNKKVCPIVPRRQSFSLP